MRFLANAVTGTAEFLLRFGSVGAESFAVEHAAVA